MHSKTHLIVMSWGIEGYFEGPSPFGRSPHTHSGSLQNGPSVLNLKWSNLWSY